MNKQLVREKLFALREAYSELGMQLPKSLNLPKSIQQDMIEENENIGSKCTFCGFELHFN